MATLPHYHNQLLFNLDAHTGHTIMPIKFHRPEPIIVEKFGPTAPGTSPLNISGPPKQVSHLHFHFKTLFKVVMLVIAYQV